MKSVLKLYNKIRYGERLVESDLVELKSDTGVKDYQKSSLIIQLFYLSDKNSAEQQMFSYLKANTTGQILNAIQSDRESTRWEDTLLFNTAHGLPLGQELIDIFIKAYVADTVDLNVVAAWLMLVNIKGLSKADTVLMTKSMMQPEDIVDYRENFSSDYFFFRRYPTGGLSEKTALILPSLLAATTKYYKVKSNFLVAKSLGYTGGTIDKLSSLAGFSAPEDPQKIISILNSFGVVMSATGNTIAYADKKMYTFRSLTGTIESLPLIVSSIGSKQLSIPSDYLLMDIRYGKGAFMKNKLAADKLGKYLNEVLRDNGQNTDFLLTNADVPTGASVGNILEILEARDLMSGNNHSIFSDDGIKFQRDIILKFYENMMQMYSPRPAGEWAKFGSRLLSSGETLEKFFELLAIHGVEISIISQLKNDSYSLIEDKHRYSLTSDKSGYLTKIEYDNIGYFINYEINYNSLTSSPRLDGGGIILKTKVNDHVSDGQILAEVISTEKLSNEQLDDLKTYFKITKAEYAEK